MGSRKIVKTVPFQIAVVPKKKVAKRGKKVAKGKKAKAGKRGKRAKKDPNAPKRPPSAYILFSNEKRPGLLKKGMKITEAMKECGALWGKLNAAGKAPFEAKAKALKAAYDKLPKPAKAKPVKKARAPKKKAAKKAKK